MASIELPLPQDPADYEPKAVAGRFSYRAFATVVAIVASEVPLIMRLLSLGTDNLPPTDLIFVLAAIPAALIALVGLSRREGLYFEVWAPQLARELLTPDTLIVAEAVPTPEARAIPSRADERAAKAEATPLAIEAEGLVYLACGGHVVPGRPASDGGAPALAVEAASPELLVRGRSMPKGLRPRQARRLRRRGCEAVPADMGRAEEVRALKWVGRRLARRACAAACDLSALTAPYDVRNEADVLAVLAAQGIEAEPSQLRLVITAEPATVGPAEEAAPEETPSDATVQAADEAISTTNDMQAAEGQG